MSFCYYCGDIADSLDHVPPRAIRKALLDSGVITDYDIKDVTACRDCNSRIGADAPFNLTDRKRLVKERLRKKYAKLLKAPDWSDSELEHVGQTLKSSILALQCQKVRIQQRLSF